MSYHRPTVSPIVSELTGFDWSARLCAPTPALPCDDAERLSYLIGEALYGTLTLSEHDELKAINAALAPSRAARDAAMRDEGREAERADVVAYLRGPKRAAWAVMYADDIAAGRHLPVK